MIRSVQFVRARNGSLVGVLVAVMAASTTGIRDASAEDASTAAARVRATAEYLASDELEGRGVGTEGLDRAAEFIAEQFEALGLDVDHYDGTPFQVFQMSTGAELGETNTVSIVPPEGGSGEAVALELNEDFTPMPLGGSGVFDLPLVFVGYGITGKDEGYDDYADVDVEGKAVIVLRHEPQQANPHSVFDGTKTSSHAPFTRKISNAYEHGAAAVIFCTDEHELLKRLERRRRRLNDAVEKLSEAAQKLANDEEVDLAALAAQSDAIQELVETATKRLTDLEEDLDPLLPFRYTSSQGETRDFPVLFVRRKVIDRVLEATGNSSLAELEAKIDEGPAPASVALDGWRVEGEVTIEKNQVDVKNVVAVLEGEGPRADETVVIGAHYDHLGFGGQGSFVPNANEIHNGADDNGSGTTMLLEVARKLVERNEPPPRRVVFIAFTAEERGLIGSGRYCREPLFPLEDTIAMLNMDMVGRLEDDKLTVYGFDTAAGFEETIDRLAEERGFVLNKISGGFGPSDHASFYAKEIPVLHFFTGTHTDYHRPSDDSDKLNYEGMQRVGDLVTAMAMEVITAEDAPEYVSTGHGGSMGGGGGDRPYFGSVPDFDQPDEPGYLISAATKGGPAEKAGIKAGDLLVQLGDSKIGNLEDFDSALRKYDGGDKVKVVVKRDGDLVTLEVTLGDPR